MSKLVVDISLKEVVTIIDTKKVERYIKIIKSGGEVENNKIEFKSEWWDLDTNHGQHEFIKDVVAMANTPGKDGYIVIGINSETGEINDSPFPKKGKINDPAKLYDLVFKKVQEPMDIDHQNILLEDKNISIIHVPESKNKPHIIKQHKNRPNFIPIRKAAGIHPASRYDLDIMYAEREKVVVPPYRLDIHFTSNTEMKHTINSSKTQLNCYVNLINTGQNINMLVDAQLYLRNKKEELGPYNLEGFSLTPGHYEDLQDNNFIKVKPNDVVRAMLAFKVDKEVLNNVINLFRINDNKLNAVIIIKDVKGNKTISEEEQISYLKMYL